MATYAMKLQESAFERIKSGRKNIELRLFDEKRQGLNLGDSIEFSNVQDINAKVHVKIIALIRYPTFEELIAEFGMEYFCYPKWYSLEKYLPSIYTIYSQEDEKKYGVLGIKLQLL